MSRPTIPPRTTWSPFSGHSAARGQLHVSLHNYAMIAVILFGCILAIVTSLVSDALWRSAGLGVFVGLQSVLYIGKYTTPDVQNLPDVNIAAYTACSAWLLIAAYVVLLVDQWEAVFSTSVITASATLLLCLYTFSARKRIAA